MFLIPDDIVNFFFDEIKFKGKYTIEIKDRQAKIIPPEHQAYYKPTIFIRDIDDLRLALIGYVECLNDFYSDKPILKDYQDLSFFLNKMLANMNNEDATDLTKYINRICHFFSNTHFKEYDFSTPLCQYGDAFIYVQRVVEEPGLETPYVLKFMIQRDDKFYPLPLVRYAIDEDNVCCVYAIQFGRNRFYEVNDEEFKNIINRINKGVKKYRNVSPSFVLTFKLFLKLLEKYNINKIVIPDYLFNRYKNYYKGTTTIRSDAILRRVLDKFILLLQRMEYQFKEFEIEFYPNEIDSYTHINLNREKMMTLSNKDDVKKDS